MRKRIILIWSICIIAALAMFACAKTSSLPADQLAVSPEMAQSNSAYDQQYREPTRSAAGAIAPAAPGEAGAPGSSSDLLSPQMAARGFDVESLFAPAAYAAETSSGEKYLIRNGEAALKVDNFEKASDEIMAIALKHRGTLTDSHMDKSLDGVSEGYVTLRVPNTEFIATWAELAKVGEVQSRSISTQDVANEYVSSVSRIKNLLKEQQTLQGMLDDARQVQRTRGLGEAYKILLDTQSKLSEVTGEMQSIEDRVSQLADQITRSTIKVNLSEREAIREEEFTWGIGDTSKAALKAVQLGVKNTLNAAIYLAITSLLWVPWVLLGWWLVYLYVRRRRRLESRPAAPKE